MADVTVEQLNKILNNTDDKIDDTYTRLASLYTKQSAQLSVNLQKLTKGLDRATNEEKKAEQKNTKSVLSPLDTIATHLYYIRRILAEQFKKTSLGSADKDVGIIKRLKDRFTPNIKDPSIRAAAKRGISPYIIAGLITAAIINEIKKQIGETWSGMAQMILKPAAFFGKQITLISNAGAKLLTFMRKFPRIFAMPLKLVKILGALGKLIPAWIKWGSFLFRYHIVEPITRWGGTIFKTLGKGFPRIARFFGILKKIAWPLTLFLEALDMVNLIYKGEDGFIKNTEKLAKEISEKGPLGRALYGLTHSLTTITAAFVTAGQTIELKWTNQLVPWVEDTTHNIFNNFLDLVNDMKNKFIEIYNWVARKIPGMTPISEEQARSSQREHAWHMISRDIKKQYGDKPSELGIGSMAEQKILEFKKRTANLEKLTGEAFTIDANEEWIKFSRRLQDAEEKYTKKRLEDPNLPRLNKNLSHAEQFELFMKAAQENPTPGVMNQNSVNILNQISPPRPIEMHGAPIGTHQLLIAPQ